MTQKAISIRQPWAHLIVSGHKPIENRSWSTTYRGPLLIHASLSTSELSQDIAGRYGVAIDANSLQFGGLIGVVELIDVITHSSSPWFSGPFGWVLTAPRKIDFIPLRGRLGLFHVVGRNY